MKQASMQLFSRWVVAKFVMDHCRIMDMSALTVSSGKTLLLVGYSDAFWRFVEEVRGREMG
jgi:hypothetical protein